MVEIRKIMQDREMYSVEPEQSVSEVARIMAALNIGAILVVQDGHLEGVFSERDLMTRVIVAGRKPETTPVGVVMSTNLATIQESATSEQAMSMMHQHGCRHLPVMRMHTVTGMISMRDLMRVELDEKTEELEQMRAYIQSAL